MVYDILRSAYHSAFRAALPLRYAISEFRARSSSGSLPPADLRFRVCESLSIPAEIDFATVTGLSFEARQTLSAQRPQTLGQASRMSGMTPAAVSLLLVHLKKKRMPALRGDAATVERSAA